MLKHYTILTAEYEAEILFDDVEDFHVYGGLVEVDMLPEAGGGTAVFHGVRTWYLTEVDLHE
jgi:hypothetical protein